DRAVDQFAQTPCQPPAKYGGGAGPSGWSGSVTIPPTARKSDFCCCAAHARRGDSCGSWPERLGTSEGGGGSVPYGSVPTGPESNITMADPLYGNDAIAGRLQNGDEGSYE